MAPAQQEQERPKTRALTPELRRRLRILGAKILGALLESQVAPALDGDVTIGKVNIEEQADLAVRFEVLSVPTLILFKDGEPVETLAGIQKPDELIQKVKELKS